MVSNGDVGCYGHSIFGMTTDEVFGLIMANNVGIGYFCCHNIKNGFYIRHQSQLLHQHLVWFPNQATVNMAATTFGNGGPSHFFCDRKQNCFLILLRVVYFSMDNFSVERGTNLY